VQVHDDRNPSDLDTSTGAVPETGVFAPADEGVVEIEAVPEQTIQRETLRDADGAVFSIVANTRSYTSVSSDNVTPNWMAAFAANLPGPGGDSTPATGRRRGR
jgi:hypothetical protein